jgi:hypothetical protein
MSCADLAQIGAQVIFQLRHGSLFHIAIIAMLSLGRNRIRASLDRELRYLISIDTVHWV